MIRTQNTLIEVTANDLRKAGWLSKKETIQKVSINEDGGISIVATIAEKAAAPAPRRTHKKRNQPVATKASTKKARASKKRVKKNAVSKQTPAADKA